jgi:hypothetical protein
MPHFDEWDDLEKHLKASGEVLKAAAPHLPGDGVLFGLPSETGVYELNHSARKYF